MADDVLAEALARVEFKLDLLMKHLKVGPSIPMNFEGHICPVCNYVTQYHLDLMKKVVVRKCQCTTGKVVFDVNMFKLPEPAPEKTTIDTNPQIEVFVGSTEKDKKS